MRLKELNVEIFRFINDLGKDLEFLNGLMVGIAEYTIYIVALLSISYFFSHNKKINRIKVLCGSITALLSIVMGKAAGMLYSNYQPFFELSNVNKLIEKEVNNSFPSDHTILIFSFCMTYWLFSKSKMKFIWLVTAFLIGISRIWIGVHYPFDVLVGALISCIVAVLIYKISFKIRQKQLN